MTDLISTAVTPDGGNTMAVFDRLNTLVNIVVGAVNTVAGKAMFDAIERVKATPLYRGEVKYNLNQAVRLYYRYEKRHLSNFGDRKQLFYDYLDYAESDIQKDVDILRISIWTLLDRHGQTDAELKSYIETALNLLEYACRVYDVQIEIANGKAQGIDFNRWMSPARLTGVLKRYGAAADMICRTEGGHDIDLNKDKNVKLAFRVIETKLTSEDFLNRAGYEAIKENPECRKYIAKEDYRELEDRYN